MRYLLEHPTAPQLGTYRHRHIISEEARDWLKRPSWVSAIAFPAARRELERLAGLPSFTILDEFVYVVEMVPNDEDLVV